ncbi:methyl-accepting chemotaxis protein [Agrobacterium tumefaciens]
MQWKVLRGWTRVDILPSVKGRLIGSFAIVTFLTVVGSFLSFLAFQNVDAGFHDLQSESLPQLDHSLSLARFASEITAKVPVIASADYAAALGGRDAISVNQKHRLEQNLKALIDSGIDSSTIDTIEKSFDDLGSNTQNLLHFKEVQFQLRGARARMIADARAAYASATGSMGPIADSAASDLEFLLQTISSTDALAPLDKLTVANSDQKFIQIRNSWQMFSEANSIIALYAEISDARTPTETKLLSGKFRSAARNIETAIEILPPELQMEDIRSAVQRLLAPGLGDRSIFAVRNEEIALTEDLNKTLRANQERIIALSGQIESLVKSAQASSAVQISSSSETVTKTRFYLALLAVFSVAVSVAIAWGYVGNNLLRRLSSIHRAISALAEGNLNFELPAKEAFRNDELGGIAKSVSVFRQNASAKLQAEKEVADQKRFSEQERERNAQQTAEAAQELEFVLDRIGTSLSQLANGDLHCEINAAFPVEYQKLKLDFNNAIGSLNDTITLIVSSTGSIRKSSTDISKAASELSARSETQAASLEETAAALSEMTANLERTADGAARARKIVEQATADANQSTQVVGRSLEAMSQIAASSEQISQIIGIINDIAFQTNLLALNAGVEASRAGDAGRGFAVVAQEVRTLAQRSADAAKEIRDLITASSSHVSDGVKMVGETGRVLNRFASEVADVNAVVTGIAESAHEQAVGLREVSQAMNSVDQMTQQNAAIAERSTSASQKLAYEANELGRLTGKFCIRSGKIPLVIASR